jgi:lipoyl(octanoyl) transferase
MKKQCYFIDIGLTEYGKAWKYQEEIHVKIINNRENGEAKDEAPNHLIFCEHPHVYTLGKSGEERNLLINDQFLEKINATYYKTNRGGDITYHGPGQIVGYPILNLENLGLGVKKYIFLLEQSIIDSLLEFGLEAGRYEGATGVWLDVDKAGLSRKICAIGVRLSRAVTMHGFALNVNTDLKYFSYINPCGFNDKGVTSMQKELGKKVDMDQVKTVLLKNFERHFDLQTIRLAK